MDISKTFVKYLIIILFSFSGLLWANDSDCNKEVKEKKENSLKEGSWSLQFQISNNLTLKSFNGSTISFKYHFTESSAIRTGISFRVQRSDSDGYIPNKDKYGLKDNMNQDNLFEVSFNSEYIYYVNPGKEVNLFFGGGPLYKYSNRFSEKHYTRNYYSDTTFVVERSLIETNSHSFGVSLLTGVEWFVKSYISLHAEYNSQIYYTTGKTEGWEDENYINDERSGTYERHDRQNNSFRFNSHYFKFGLSVYF